MHIADGVLSPAVIAGTVILSVGGIGMSLKKIQHDEIPRVSLMAAACFVVSMIHINIGPASTHLNLSGLTGLLLGWSAFPSMGSALLLQCLFFGYGGLTAWGANTLNSAFPALCCFLIFRPIISRSSKEFNKRILAASAGALAVIGNCLMLAASLYLSSPDFLATIYAILISQLPVIIAEAVITAFVVSFLGRVKPEIFS